MSSFTVQLIDDVGLLEGTKMTVMTIIEEFLKPKKVSAFITDLVPVRTKPVGQTPEIKVDQDVTVQISWRRSSRPT